MSIKHNHFLSVTLEILYVVSFITGHASQMTVCVQRYEESLADFQQTFKELRGNQLIDYGALGLRYKLNACEVSAGVFIIPLLTLIHPVNGPLQFKYFHSMQVKVATNETLLDSNISRL